MTCRTGDAKKWEPEDSLLHENDTRSKKTGQNIGSVSENRMTSGATH